MGRCDYMEFFNEEENMYIQDVLNQKGFKIDV